MQPKNSILLPVAALLMPVALYLVVASFVAPVLSSLQISSDILLGVLGFAYLLVILYSNTEAKSQSKFFKKHFPETENVDGGESEGYHLPLRRGTLFFINVVGNVIAIALWIFFFPDDFSESIGVSNIWYQVVVLLLIMFLASNIFRIIATSMFASVDYKTSINSAKFIIASDVFWYGLIGAYFLFLGGFFV